MLAKIINKIRASIAQRELSKLPAFQVGREAIQFYWTGDSETTAGFSSDFVRREAEKMADEVIRIATSPDPRMANRERLAAQVTEYAAFLVLILDPAVPDPNKLRGRPGITGELSAHLLDLMDKDEGLREFMHGIDRPSSAEDASAIVHARFRVVHAWTHLFQMLRTAFDDLNHAEGKDWFRPFVAAMCAWRENIYRSNSGMPPSLPLLVTLCLSGWAECVTANVRYPDLEWHDRWKRTEKSEEEANLVSQLLAP